ncbi:MAG TPA: ATP-binding protein [Chloroflexota bacterium]|nr:ATP-binding protein [Chloroflexota bacterium]
MSRTPRGLLAADLAHTNPWWGGKGWQSNDPQLEAVARAPFTWHPTALDDMAPPNVYTLRGPRRVGKSTLLKQQINRLCAEVDPRQIVYIAADLFRTRTDLQNIIQAARGMFPTLEGKPRYYFVDEITAIKDWHVAVKWLRDNTLASRDCFVLTGSSAADIAPGTESLAGRRGPDDALDRLLLPMPFPIFAHYAGFDLPSLPRLTIPDFYSPDGRAACQEALVYLDRLVIAYEQYLAVGGFPQAVAGLLRSGAVPAGFARDLWDVVQSDLRHVGVSRPEKCLRLLERLVHATCAPVAFRKLGEELDVDQRTAQSWVEALANSYLVFLLFKENDGVPDLNSVRKVYLTDPALASLPQRLAPGSGGPNPTQLAETVLAMAFFRTTERNAVDRFTRPQRLFYYTSKKNTEIDFLVHPGSRVADSKYVDTPDHREARAMVENFGEALLLTRTATDLDNPQSLIVPAPVFCWLLDQPV